MTEKVSRLKFYSDNITNNTSILSSPDTVKAVWNADGSYVSAENKVTKNREVNEKNVSYDRQFVPILYQVDRDLETDMRNASCKTRIRGGYDMDQIVGIGGGKFTVRDVNEKEESKPNQMRNTFLIDDPAFKEAAEVYNINCSERRRNLNWADYRAPAKQTSQGFGNPENYVGIRLGQDTRLRTDREINENPRGVDLLDRSMIPLDSTMINYAGIEYDKDIRSGIQTRAFKKVDTSFENYKRI
jgi:hypothetical protein